MSQTFFWHSCVGFLFFGHSWLTNLEKESLDFTVFWIGMAVVKPQTDWIGAVWARLKKESENTQCNRLECRILSFILFICNSHIFCLSLCLRASLFFDFQFWWWCVVVKSVFIAERHSPSNNDKLTVLILLKRESNKNAVKRLETVERCWNSIR